MRNEFPELQILRQDNDVIAFGIEQVCVQVLQCCLYRRGFFKMNWITIEMPEWIKKEVQDELFAVIRALCRLLSDDEIKVCYYYKGEKHD